jgi:hypothetical protein
MTQSGEKLFMNASDWYKLDYDKMPVDKSQFEKPVKYKFDASQMRELRKPYKKLLKYADTMLKLSGEGVTRDDKLNEEISQYKNKLDLYADEDKTYQAYYHIVLQCQHHKWSGNYPNHKEVTYCNIGMIKRYLDKQIKLENPQVLVEVQPATSV